ncbi:hypothetical protein [Soonwooa sp.]|uniref:hypothetical protein n=1 Tax=Soonwooa sp. TaxID=1938592 RepID=UPI0028B13551|nr:hypothetical protein [Soonwooa sp.]
MTGFEKDVLQNELCNNCDCTGFNAAATFAVAATAKTVTVTDTSTFGAGDDLNVINVHVYDKEGKQKHGQITVDAGNVVIDVSTFNLNSIDILVTVVSTKGCKADLGVYNVVATANSSGAVVNKANQGNRNLKK